MLERIGLNASEVHRSVPEQWKDEDLDIQRAAANDVTAIEASGLTR
jgi:hypothetical protein